MSQTVVARIDKFKKHMYYDGEIWVRSRSDSHEYLEKRIGRKKIIKILKSFIDNEMGDRSESMRKIFKSIRHKMCLKNVDKNKELWMPEFDSKHFYRTIYSDMQSKKTAIMASICLYVVLGFQMSVFIFVQNRKADLAQITQRLTEFLSSWHSNIDRAKIDMVVLEPERGKLATLETFRSAMAGIPKIFVCLFSAKDINPLVKMVQACDLKRYFIILDESDLLDNGKDKESSIAFENFCEHAVCVQNVTATPLTTLSHRVCLRRHFIVMPSPAFYKGLANMFYRDLPLKAKPCNNKADNPLTKDPNLISFLEKYHEKPIPVVSITKEKVPNYLLARMGRTIGPQLLAAAYTHAHYPKSVVITWNGGEDGSTLRCANLPKTSIIIPGTQIKSKYKDGVHHLRNVHIGQILTYLHTNRLDSKGELQFEYIIVFAGQMADRGITFGADNYSECQELGCAWWHLTDLYYIGRKNGSKQNLANILQACARICGVYNDNIPLTIYSNWVDGIREGYKLEQELINRVQSIGNPDENILETLREMKVSKEKKLKKMCLTNGGVREPLKWVDGSDVKFGGWTDEKRMELMKGSRIEEVWDSSGSIYTIDPNNLSGHKARLVSEVIDQIAANNVWVARATIINRLVSLKGYILNTIRADLTRLQQSVPANSSVKPGLNFRKIAGKEEMELLYCP